MRNRSRHVTLSPVASKGDNAESIMFLPFHGGGTASINVAGITRGYPTVVTLGSSPACIGGQTVKLASVGGMTQINGYHKVLWVSGTSVALDVNSSAYGAWTSGGAMTFNHVGDRFDNYGPLDIAGTVSGIWANTDRGITCHASGSWVERVTSGDLFDLVGFTGKIVFSAHLKLNTAPPTGTELLFGINRVDQTGTATRHGGVAIGFYGASQNPSFIFRPVTASDSAGINTTCALGAIGTAATCCQWVLDLETDTIYGFKDGALMSTATIDRTNSIGNPSLASIGMVILGGMDGTGAVTGKMGSGGSGAYVENLLWWKTTKSMSAVTKALRDLYRTGEFPAHLL